MRGKFRIGFFYVVGRQGWARGDILPIVEKDKAGAIKLLKIDINSAKYRVRRKNFQKIFDFGFEKKRGNKRKREKKRAFAF